MTSVWLDRSLFRSPLYYALCTSQRLYDKELKRMKLGSQPGILNDHSGATTNFMQNVDGKQCAIVCLFNHSYDYEQIASLLAHEAVHIFQRIRENIGESSPSAEFEAYSIQAITQNLLYEYKRQVRRRKGKK